MKEIIKDARREIKVLTEKERMRKAPYLEYTVSLISCLADKLESLANAPKIEVTDSMIWEVACEIWYDHFPTNKGMPLMGMGANTQEEYKGMAKRALQAAFNHIVDANKKVEQKIDVTDELFAIALRRFNLVENEEGEAQLTYADRLRAALEAAYDHIVGGDKMIEQEGITVGKWYNYKGDKVEYTGTMIGHEHLVCMRKEGAGNWEAIPYQEAIALKEWEEPEEVACEHRVTTTENNISTCVRCNKRGVKPFSYNKPEENKECECWELQRSNEKHGVKFGKDIWCSVCGREFINKSQKEPKKQTLWEYVTKSEDILRIKPDTLLLRISQYFEQNK